MSVPVIVITGATNGIGLETVKKLAQTPCHLIIIARNLAKAETVSRELNSYGICNTEIVEADLNSLSSTAKAAHAIRAAHPKIDVLINNAGLLMTTLELTEEGFEKQFGVNYLSHFLLTQILLPNLQKAPQARIIHTASFGHWFGGALRPETFKHHTQFNSLRAYGQSKLANLLFSHKMARRLSGSTVTSNALHPGAVATDIYHRYPKIAYYAMRPFLISPVKSAQRIFEMATSPAWAHKNGEYSSLQTPNIQTKHARNPAVADLLYDQSMLFIAPFLVTSGSDL